MHLLPSFFPVTQTYGYVLLAIFMIYMEFLPHRHRELAETEHKPHRSFPGKQQLNGIPIDIHIHQLIRKAGSYGILNQQIHLFVPVHRFDHFKHIFSYFAQSAVL